MTKISLYPHDTNIQDDDILLGTDKETPSNETKNFTVGDLKSHILSAVIVSNSTDTYLSSSQLISAYPDNDYPVGTQVYCPNILIVGSPVKSVVYVKNAPGSWYVNYIDQVS